MAGESNAFFLKEADSILPDYRINNIIVEEKSIRLFCSLDKDADLNYDSLFASSEFFKYINFYFILVGNLNASQIAKLYHPKTRIQSLKYGDNDAGLLNWEKSFESKHHSSIIGIKQRDKKHIYSQFGFVKVNLEEILTGDYSKNETLPKNFKPVNLDSIIAGTAYTNVDPSDDTFFEVVLQCDTKEQGYASSWLAFNNQVQANSRNIVSFCQLDIKKIAEDFGLESFVGTLGEYGGPMHWEKLLELSPSENPDSRMWMVPKTTSYFEDGQGNPFKGVAHYHGQNNPGPNGYIGWMSGPSVGDMENRIALTRREILNTKVVSKIHIGRGLGFDGNPLTDENRFLGYPDAASTTGDSVPSPYGDLSFGENILSVLRSEVGMGMLEVQTGSLEPGSTRTADTIRDRKMKKLVLTKEMAGTSNFIDFVNSYLSVRESKYATLFNINKEQVLKTNSQYGYLLDFHREALDPDTYVVSRMLEQGTDAQRQSYNFIKNCIDRTRIYTMKISRKRLTNLPESNNATSTSDYLTYDNNDIQEILVKFSDSNDLPESVDDDLRADLVEVFKDYYSPRGIQSLFRLDDFDLYNSVTHGRYRYTVELALVDGVKEYLKDLYNSYFNSLKAFERYVKEAEKPYLRNYTLEDDQPVDNRGSYDYQKEQFSQNFKDRAEEFSGTILNAISYALGAAYMLTKKESYNLKMADEMLSMLSPETADIGNLKMFLDFMQKIGNTLKQRIFKNNTNIEETMNLGTHKRRVGAGNTLPDSLITVKSDIMGSVEVVSKNSVFYSTSEPFDSGEREVSEFFTLQTEILDTDLAQDQNDNPDVINPGYLNSAGEILSRRATYTKRSLGSISQNYSEIASAISYSPFGETYDPNIVFQHSNPLGSHNSAITDFGGATFNYLLTETLSLTEVSTNACGEQVTTIPTTVEQGIFDSIVALDNKDDFLQQIEEQYKDYYFTKEALGNLYTFIKHTMSNRNILTNMSVRNTEAKLQKYRYRVERGISTEQHRSQVNQLRRDQTDPSNTSLTDLYVYTVSKGFVPAETNPVDSLGIFERRPKNNVKDNKGTMPVLVDNVYVDEGVGISTSINETIQTPSTATTSARRTSTTSARRTLTRPVGGGNSGY